MNLRTKRLLEYERIGVHQRLRRGILLFGQDDGYCAQIVEQVLWNALQLESICINENIRLFRVFFRVRMLMRLHHVELPVCPGG